MSDAPISRAGIPKRARIALIIAAIIPLVIVGFFGIWILTHQETIRRQQMYVSVGEAVIKNWNNLSETTRREIEASCNPVNMAQGWLTQKGQ
jgi:fatty acid desaturase